MTSSVPVRHSALPFSGASRLKLGGRGGSVNCQWITGDVVRARDQEGQRSSGRGVVVGAGGSGDPSDTSRQATPYLDTQPWDSDCRMPDAGQALKDWLNRQHVAQIWQRSATGFNSLAT